jgi:hypothetical protein
MPTPELIGIKADLTVVPMPFTSTANLPEARGALILLAGGNGVVGLDARGRITNLNNNFLIRSREAFLQQGFHVVVFDALPVYPANATDLFNDGLNNKRMTVQHASELSAVTSLARTRWFSDQDTAVNSHVWLVGTSNGTLSAVNALARLPRADFATNNGIILTSAITQTGISGETHNVFGRNLNSGIGFNPIDQIIANNSLMHVIWHRDDRCPISPGSSGNTVLGTFNFNSNHVHSNEVTGGIDPVGSAACGGSGHHGFAGIEPLVIRLITNNVVNPV